MTSPRLRLLYLVHDVADAAVHKRIAMLQDGGAKVLVAGFRRSAKVTEAIHGCRVFDLGQTYNGSFSQRIKAVVQIILRIGKYRDLFAGQDVILARNLEMLAIAVRGRAAITPDAVIAYESLDIHRLLLKSGPVGKALRWLEGRLSRRAAVLVTSSPAFVENYFKPFSSVKLPIYMLENKVYAGEAAPPAPTIDRPDGPPWRIGWFGAIRCHKSLAILQELAVHMQGAVEIIIRGKPAYDQFDDFEKTVSTTPHLRFMGPYKNPDDLQGIYGEAHFTWAIDMFEEGLNSSWLLPNRIYEGGRYGAVPLAQQQVEIGKMLKRLNIGVTFENLTPAVLADFFAKLTSFEYKRLAQTAMSVPAEVWTFTTEDSTRFVTYLSNLKGHA